MDSNKLAIVIPYYKLTYFEETLISLQNQTDQRFNLYIGDDASPENPSELIDKYSGIIKKYKRFDTNLGGKELTKQWERCIDSLVENEEWIMLLCDDDILTENYIEKFYLNLNEVTSLNISLVKYNCKVINSKYELVQGPYQYEKIELSTMFFKKLFFNEAFSTLSENIFRKDKYYKYKFQNIELAFGSDAIAVLEFSEFSNIYIIKDEYMTFRRSDINISGNRSDSVLKRRKMIGNTHYMFYLLVNYSDKFDYDTKVEMCKMLYRNYRPVYRNQILKNMKFLSIIFKLLNFSDFKKLITKKYDY
ncbi:glycosyltransferase [Empedobacter brevis]|uniref:glycosyltransferase n=1 Tax=Empedobacter brevis TaxID=247 RepID=UPI0028985D42|nr:glycosyltransferase [Empedobacter brevis]